MVSDVRTFPTKIDRHAREADNEINPVYSMEANIRSDLRGEVWRAEMRRKRRRRRASRP